MRFAGTQTYQVEQMIRATEAERETLKIWQQHRDEIATACDLSDGRSPRILWGWYRHSVEAALLVPVLAAYRQAVAEKRIVPEPGRKDVLQIRWAVNKNDQPYVAEVQFLAGGKEKNLPPVLVVADKS